MVKRTCEDDPSWKAAVAAEDDAWELVVKLDDDASWDAYVAAVKATRVIERGYE